MRTFSVIAVLVFVLHVSSGIEFAWSTLKAGKCVANDTMIGSCSKPRDAQCLNKVSGKPVPDYYCREAVTSPKPTPEVSCELKECTRQRCIVSSWSKWNMCDPACMVSFKYRTRSTLWRERQDDRCPSLIEKQDCDHCTRGSSKDIYQWMVAKWGTCRQFKTITAYQEPNVNTTDPNSSQQSSGDTNGRVCGPVLRLGKATRKVRCVNAKGVETRARNCMNSKDKYGRITQRPARSKVCLLPCDCHLSKWSTWGGCPKDCSTREEQRTRSVLYPAQLNGKPCGSLVQRRLCKTQCTSVTWYATPWGRCQSQNLPGSRNYSSCGYGFQERAHVFCAKSSSNMSDLQPVDDNLCDPATKLVARRPCKTPCASSCKVSEWEEWGPCSVSCGRYGIKKRERRIVEPASDGGMDCPHLTEISPCGTPQCASWATKQWGPCWASGKCTAVGIKVRLVYCAGPDTKYIKDKNCAHLLKPSNKMNCARLCPGDCALSDWSDWGSCSKSCGIQGGIQVRYKRILAYPEETKASCPSADQLKQTRKCNEHTFCEQDSNLMWRTMAWGECTPKVKGTCGVAKGTTKRVVFCGTYTKAADNESLCAGIPKPGEEKGCDLPCKKDCVLSKWQGWSECSSTCGGQGNQTRKRFVLQKGSLGGHHCPSHIKDEIMRQVRACRTACYEYKWQTTAWSKCEILPQSKSVGDCGGGYQTRTVSCVRSDDQRVKLSSCYLSLLTPPPLAVKECWKPCAQSCVRSDWSAWQSCPDTCTSNTPRYRNRSRTILNLSPARGGFAALCPTLSALDFFDKQECPQVLCFTYKWYSGRWQSCLPNKMSSCENGMQGRNVLCQRSDNTFVMDSYCTDKTKPVPSRPCLLTCDTDCIVSKWQPWSVCTHPCGESIQERNRTILKQSSGLGRVCPHLNAKRLCRKTPCTDFKWSVGLWGTCTLSDNKASCGNGTQTRKVSCHPDRRWQTICLKQAPKPKSKQPCELPCPGDCVLSNWAMWSDCVNGWKGCNQNRWRTVVRKPSVTKLKCSNITQQTQPCDCPSAGKLVVSEWSSCVLNKTDGAMCGKGSQYRSVHCVGKKGEVLEDIYCTKRDTITTVQECTIDCPVDCVLTRWSDWSQCSCGADSTTMRTRHVLVTGVNGGRKCPDKSGLVQTKPCNHGPCYTYSLDRGTWSKCYVDGQGCGHGTKSREIKCRRSDGRSVQLHYCFGNLKSNDSQLLDKLDILPNVLNNITKLSILMKESCVDPCPGNCVFSDWSDWSECGRTCFEQNGKSFQSRSRVIISKATAGGRACPSTLSEIKQCQPVENKCIGFEWKVGAWQKNDQRDVWCETTNGVRVSEACLEEKKPTSSKSCDPKCSDPNTICQDGVCLCKPSFELFQKQCIPVQGCLHNTHCVFPNTACKNQLCKCRPGHVLNTTTGLCVLSDIPIITTIAPPTSTVSSSTAEEEEYQPSEEPISVVTDGSPSTTPYIKNDVEKKALENEPEESEDYMKWIGISAGVLLFCILLVVGVFCYTRKQKKTKKQSYKRERENSIELIGLQTIPADDYETPTKV